MANANTAVGIKDTKRDVKHPFETHPPTQQRFVVNDDNWRIADTSFPTNHRDISSNLHDSVADSCGNTNAMRPVYSDSNSAYIEHSHTDGRKK